MWDDLKALPGWSLFDKVSWYSFLIVWTVALVSVCGLIARLMLGPFEQAE